MSDTETKPELPGYELLEKIGAGGYGEVWSAVAPGGMRKAVKFVFGSEYDKRATSELHALEKIKAVRHPFLLSLERIEVIDGRLVVVAELADASLRDRFRECVSQGLPGIPREELVGYLSDAADALDFIGTRHDLAHLDIKPENLLLVAGHVKVADFGLVKSLSNQTQASLVGGMTPTYAAPEVFRGTPSRQSDQYSLAILYQEMLTGSVPFPGINAAELTLQHMNDDPDLSRMSDADRFTVARALAKDPDNRFESCSAFVAALDQKAAKLDSFQGEPAQTRSEALPSAPPIPAEAKLNRHSATEVFDGPVAVAEPADSIVVLPDPLERPGATQRDTPEAGDDAPFKATPAVFVGIGATGARVLRSLRSQMNEHLGAAEPLAAAPMLLLDTDPQTLASATGGGDRGLNASETIALPLRRPQAYREKADLLLRWLGRRWLYNIPRTLRTEGIRPLGRLALVDHARQAFQRLRGVLTSAIDESSRAASTQQAGLSFEQPGVRVYVVGSIAGAAGSGMSIDVAYAVRSILERSGVEDATILGLMTHSTLRDATRAELARVNSYSWLCEYQRHRTSEDGYPGDDSVGLPAHDSGVAGFDHTYFIPLGEQIETHEFESAAEAVAEYLFADAFTSSQRVLDACREQTSAGETLRSFAVRHRDGQSDLTLNAVEQLAVARMLDRWLGGDPAAEDEGSNATDQVVHGTVAFLGRTQLDSSTLASNCRSLLEASLGGDASAYIDARFTDRPSRHAGELAAVIDKCFGIMTADAPPTEVDGAKISSIVSPITQKLSEEVYSWVLGRVNDTQERLDGAAKAVVWMEDYLHAVNSDLQKVMASVLAERSRSLDEVATNLASPSLAREARIKLFRLRLDQSALVAARSVVEGLVERVAGLPDELGKLRSVIEDVSNALSISDDSADASLADAHRLSVQIEQRLQTDYLLPHGGLLGSLSHPQALEKLPSTIAHAAKVIARDENGGGRAAADAALAAGFPPAPLSDVGGEYYHLTLSQPQAGRDDSQSEGEDEMLLVTEMASVSLPHAAAQLIGGRRDYAAFAERVRTRRDIPWVDVVTGTARGEETQAAPVATLIEPTPVVPAQTAVLT